MYQVKQVETSHHLENIYLNSKLVKAAIFQVKKQESKLEWEKMKIIFSIVGIIWNLFWLLFQLILVLDFNISNQILSPETPSM